MQNLDFLPSILILLFAAVFIVAAFTRLQLSPVLGYFVAGAAIGPQWLNILQPEDTHILAEFGVVFLLFAIGLELTFERLVAMRSHVFGFGTMQVVITSILLAFGMYYLTPTMPTDIKSSIIIGWGLALSSTAIVLQVMMDSGRQSTQVGRLSLAVLLLQDFAVIPLLVLLPLLAEEGANIPQVMGTALLKAIVTMVVIFMLGRLLLRPIFRLIGSTKSEELFVATTLLVVLGTSFATHYVGLSQALGAFMAGLMVAETGYQHQAENSINPFKGLFLGLFFMTVGMSIDVQSAINHLVEITILSTGLILIKAVIIIIICRIFGFPIGSSIHAGLLLSQGGEFAFILFRLATEKHIIDPETSQILLLVVTLTMALTPLLSAIGQRLADVIDRSSRDEDKKNEFHQIDDLNSHIIIAGFGRVGMMVARLLTSKKVSYIALEIDEKRVTEGRSRGFPLYHGDVSKEETLAHLGIERAQAIIVSMSNEITMRKTLKTIRQLSPDIPVVVRIADMRHSEELYAMGADILVPETYETGLQIGGATLKAIGFSEHEVVHLKHQFRAGQYIMAKIKDNEEEEISS